MTALAVLIGTGMLWGCWRLALRCLHPTGRVPDHIPPHLAADPALRRCAGLCSGYPPPLTRHRRTAGGWACTRCHTTHTTPTED